MNDARFGPAPAVIGLYRIINDEVRGVGWLAWTWYRPPDDDNAASEQHLSRVDDWSGGLTD